MFNINTIFKESFDSKCDDCGNTGTIAEHFGVLVPPDKTGKFCRQCWMRRIINFGQGLPVRDLGHQNKKN